MLTCWSSGISPTQAWFKKANSKKKLRIPKRVSLTGAKAYGIGLNTQTNIFCPVLFTRKYLCEHGGSKKTSTQHHSWRFSNFHKQHNANPYVHRRDWPQRLHGRSVLHQLSEETDTGKSGLSCLCGIHGTKTRSSRSLPTIYIFPEKKNQRCPKRTAS